MPHCKEITYIKIRYFFIKYTAKAGEVKLEHKPTENMQIDVST